MQIEVPATLEIVIENHPIAVFEDLYLVIIFDESDPDDWEIWDIVTYDRSRDNQISLKTTPFYAWLRDLAEQSEAEAIDSAIGEACASLGIDLTEDRT